MNHPMHNGIVRVFSINNSIVGSGFVIFDNIICTCAHVIADALNIAYDDASIPLHNEIVIDFPYLSDSIYKAEVKLWMPVLPNEKGDIAVLEIINDLPWNAKSLNLIRQNDFVGRRFEVYGFPNGYNAGVWSNGVLGYRLSNGWVQIEGDKSQGFRIQPGYSGSPVWDIEKKGVIGIIVAAASAKDSDTKAGFLIPNDIIIDFLYRSNYKKKKSLEELLFENISYKYQEEFVFNKNRLNIDWGEAPDITTFYGRHEELSQLNNWILKDRCRLIGVFGTGGIGKSVLVAKLSDQIKGNFEYVIWCSLRNAPLFDEVISEWIPFLSDQKDMFIPENKNKSLHKLLDNFKFKKCLLILDNFESILCDSKYAGECRESYIVYNELLRAVGNFSHKSTIIVTSREKLNLFAQVGGDKLPIRSLNLNGLGHESGEKLIQDKGLYGSQKEWHKLVDFYSGNPLSLKLVSETILEIYNGNISVFLNDGLTVFGDIYDLINQQFNRLSQFECEILYWLSIKRESSSTDDLINSIVTPISKRQLIESLTSLKRRYFVEVIGPKFTLQNVVMEFVTDKFIDIIYEEISQNKLKLFKHFLILEAQAKVSIRQSQTRLILEKLSEKLYRIYKDEEIISDIFLDFLPSLRNKKFIDTGYSVGNIINLLLFINNNNISKNDFSNLFIRQAFLQDSILQDVNFESSTFSESVFSNTFANILSVKISSDGKLLAVGDLNGDIHLFSIPSFNKLFVCRGHNTWIRSFSFNSSNDQFASASDDHTIRLWDIKTGACLKVFEGHSGWVYSLDFSKDDKFLISGGEDKILRKWDVFTGGCVQTFEGHNDRIWSVKYLYKDNELVSSSQDKTLKLWNSKTGKCLKTISIKNGWIRSFVQSDDGSTLVCGNDVGIINLIEQSLDKEIKALEGHNNSVLSVASKGKIIASSSEDKTIRLWDLQSGVCFKTLQGHKSGVCSIDLLGNILISGGNDQTVMLWDVCNGACLKSLKGYSNAIEPVLFFNEEIIIGGCEDGSIRFWNITTGLCQKILTGHTDWVRSITINQDRSILYSCSYDKTVRIWDISSGICKQIFKEHKDCVKTVSINKDDTILASSGYDKEIKLWDISSGNYLKTLNGHSDKVQSVCFSPDDKFLASGSHDKTVQLWDYNEGTQIKTFKGHNNWIRTIAFSPNGKLLASAGFDMKVYLWDMVNFKNIGTFEGHTDDIECVTFSPDSKKIASCGCDCIVKLWDVNTKSCILNLSGHTHRIASVVFHPINELLASGSKDGTIRLWNLVDGECLKILRPDRPYERMNICNIKGLTKSQIISLKNLGAKDSI